MSRKIESLLQEAGRALEVFIGLVCALISGTFVAMRKNVNIIVIFSSVIAFNRIEAGVLYTFSETASGVQLTYSGSLNTSGLNQQAGLIATGSYINILGADITGQILYDFENFQPSPLLPGLLGAASEYSADNISFSWNLPTTSRHFFTLLGFGDTFGFYIFKRDQSYFTWMNLPWLYVSGAPINGGMLFAGESLSSMGLSRTQSFQVFLPGLETISAIVLPVGPRVVTSHGTNVLNPQTGLFEQNVTVTNVGDASATAVRLLVGGLRTNDFLYNAVGTNGSRPYVQYNAPLNPGQTVQFALEFYASDRQPFTNAFEVQAVLPSSTSTNGPLGVAIDHVFIDSVTADSPRFIIEFTSIPGRTYTIIYSDDGLVTWQAATPTITANANRTLWYDDGPPKTGSKPLSNMSRMYRVIERSPPPP